MPTEFVHWYNWSDHDLFAGWLTTCVPEGGIVFEVASGPNIVTPHLLKRLGPPYNYVACELNPAHLQLQRQGAYDENCLGTNSDATCLPLKSASADLAVFHHAIDDIYETKGKQGLEVSFQEAWRVLKSGGHAIFSHCEFPQDEASLAVDLALALELLLAEGFIEVEQCQASAQDWLLVQKPHKET